MKITIIGGSQGTGAQLASLAHTAGHDVTVVSRSGKGEHGVRSLAGDASDPGVAAEAVAAADAVVITVGAAKGTHHQRAAVTRAVVTAMESAGVSRLVVQSSLGAGDSASQLPAVMRFITTLVLAKPLADHNEQEAAVMNSGLDWTGAASHRAHEQGRHRQVARRGGGQRNEAGWDGSSWRSGGVHA
ncbi:NAD(P)-dependent oxidoreductase [Arthrobacter psychrolactophilus]